MYVMIAAPSGGHFYYSQSHSNGFSIMYVMIAAPSSGHLYYSQSHSNGFSMTYVIIAVPSGGHSDSSFRSWRIWILQFSPNVDLANEVICSLVNTLLVV